ncbi:IDEAL domain-containing protein [Paenibacillus sp. HN-1]|uniref:IDEAL domain-containing protein n=1 Tax=Paenibacillus TaxID=44249 RepID=UPI001CA858B0|nr:MULTISPECIES: IDEAL domain-containing protein [Paenibacillus]MBY9080812.1 IDEAL domain-containing protein [Paenibacillus sp. CGMCC 1.18879]MBY9085196.1 IDEAL domain-containing protein [Paenibacillus sinensis]
MIRLETNDIVSIAKKQIASIFKMEPLELRFVNDFQGEKNLLVDDKLHLTNRHYWAKVMDCVFENQVRPVLMCEVLYFLRNEYLESEIDLKFSFDFSSGDHVEAAAVAEVNFNDQTELGPNEIAELIDFALALQDKQWFEELTKKYKELTA